MLADKLRNVTDIAHLMTAAVYVVPFLIAINNTRSFLCWSTNDSIRGYKTVECNIYKITYLGLNNVY